MMTRTTSCCKDSANQEPINKGYTSHLQRANKALKAQEGEQEEDGAAERKIKMQRRERAEERVAARVRKKLPAAKGKVMKKPSSQSLSLEASGSKEAPKKVKKKDCKKEKIEEKERPEENRLCLATVRTTRTRGTAS